MPDNKQYYVQIPAEGDGQGQEKVVDAQSYENHKDELFNAYKNASVKELTDINPAEQFDYRADDEFEVSVDDLGEKKVVSADQFVKNMDKLYKAYPNARVTRRRNVNYWGERLGEIENRIGSLKKEMESLPQDEGTEIVKDINLEDADIMADDIIAASSTSASQQGALKRRKDIKNELDQLYRMREGNYAYQQFWAGQAQQADDAIKDIETRRQKLAKKIASGEKLNTMLGQGVNAGYQPRAQRDEDLLQQQATLTAAKHLFEDARKTALAPSRYGGDESGAWHDFWQGMKDGALDAITVVSLGKVMDEASTLVPLLKRAQDVIGKNASIIDFVNNEMDGLANFSPEEKLLLHAFVKKAEIEGGRGETLSRSYQAGQGAIQSAGFMADFALAGGIGNAAAKAVVGNAVKAAGKSALKKVGAETLYGLIKAGSMTPFMPSFYANATNNILQFNDAGGVDLSGKAMLRAGVDGIIENVSETIGGKPLEFLAIPAEKIKFFAWGKAMRNSPWMQSLKQAGWNGLFEEYVEEWTGNALRVMTGVDKDALKNFATIDQQLVTLGAFAPMTLLGGGVTVPRMIGGSKALAQRSKELQAILGEKMDETTVNAALNVGDIQSPEDLGKHMGEVYKQAVEAGVDPAAAYRGVMQFTDAAAKYNVLKGMFEEQKDIDRSRELLKTNKEVGNDNWYHGGENGANFVRIITDAEGNERFVVGDAENTLALVDRAGNKSMISYAELQEAVDFGTLTDSGEKYLNDYLDDQTSADRKRKETERMATEAQQNAQELYSRAQIGTEVNLGTVESPNPGIIREIQPDRFIVEAADGVREVSPEQMAGYLGLPYRPKTDAEIENQQVSVEQRRADLRNRAQALIGTDIASILGIDGEATLLRVHNTPENEQQGLFPVDYERGGEYNVTMVSEDQLAQMVAMGEQEPAAVVKEEEAQEQQQRSDAPVDFRGNPLPMRTNSITGEQVVDGELLWKTDPEAWAYWNDTNPKQRTTSVERLDYTIKKVEGQIEKQEKDIHKAALEGVSDEQMDKMEYDLSQLQQRAESLQGILNNYRRAERREARELAEPQTLDELAANGLAGMQHRLDREDFKRETGWSDTELNKFFPWWAKKGQGLTLKEVAEQIAHDEGQTGLVPQDASADQPDVQAVRDAVIDVLRSASVPSDIANYTRNANLARREQMEREAKAAEEAARLQTETKAAVAAQEQTAAWPDGDMPDFENMETPLQAEISAAREQVDTNPTEAQKEAGNYAKGHITIDGYNITIENPKGSTRSGVDASGKEWSQVMNNDYGYIRMTEGVDGDHIDVFLSDNPEQGDVFVVDQIDPQTGEFDEHKVMYGFGSAEQAREAYLTNYEPGWKGLGTITEVSKEEFKKWIESSHRKTKPFADYKSVKPVGAQGEGAFDAALNKSLDIEQSWEERIADYIFEHYPTQATVSARTNSPEGRAEREAMKKDAVLQDMLEKQKAAMAAADADVRTALEAEETSQPQAGVDLDVTLADGGRTAILKRIDKWKKLLGNIFIVHDDISTIDDPTVLERIREFDSRVAAGEPRDAAAVRGWFDPATGTAHIYLPHLLEMSNRRRNLDETILHEVISHKGLRALFGKKYNAFLDVVWRDLMGPESRERELGYVNGSAQNVRDRRAAADEFLAHAAEGESAIVKQLDATWWQRLANAVKEFVNTTLGVDVFKDVSTEGFARLLQDAMKVLKKNGNSFDQVDSSKRFSFTDVRFPASVTKEQRETISKTLKDYTDQTQHQKVKEVCVDIDKRIEVENEEINGPILREIGDVRVRLKELNAQKGRIFQRNEGKENIPIINAEIQQLKTREKELRDSIKKVNLSAFDVKRRKDQAIIETGILDNDTWRGVGVVPTFELEVEKELKRMGWNGEDNMMYATEYGFVSHWEGHHPDMTESEVSYDMLRNMYEPTVVGFEARYPDTMLFIRNDENGLWYITAVKANHIKNDGSLLLATTYKDKENPSKKLARTLSLGRQKGTVASNQIHRSFNDHGAKVSKNSELASKYSKKEAQTLKTQDVLGSPKTEELTEFSPETHEGTALFSVKDDNGKKTLVGIHNIEDDKLSKALHMGGLANPSAAVVDLSHQDHFGFGDISLIMPSSMVDMRTGRNAGTFDRDAWTPRYPTVHYFSTKESEKNVKKLVEGLPDLLVKHIPYTLNMYLEGNVYNSGLEYIFLKEKGEEPSIQTTPRQYPHLTVERIYEKLGLPTGTDPNDTNTILDAYEGLSPERRREFNIFYHSKGDPQKIALREELSRREGPVRRLMERNNNESIGLGKLDTFIWSAIRDVQNAGKEDADLTIAKAIEIIGEKGYAHEFGLWQDKAIFGLGYKEMFYAGKTPAGNPKYLPNTLENVSKWMKKQGQNASSDHAPTGTGILGARLAQKFSSLQQIRANKSRLVDFGNKEEDRISNRIQDAIKTFMDFGNGEGMYAQELVAQECVEDIVLRGADVDKVVERYNKEAYTPISLSEQEKQELRDLREAVVNMPTFYFETKFERPVALNEFAAAVVPTDIAKGLRDALKASGLAIYEFKRRDGESRSEAVREASEADGIRFSFIGERGARIADNASDAPTKMRDLEAARRMEEAGTEPRMIKVCTNWERGADKKWRYELNDDWKFDVTGNTDYRKRNPGFARWEELLQKRNMHAFYPEDHADLTAEEEAQFDELNLIYSHPVSAYKNGRNPHHNSSRVKDYIDAPELFAAYPGIRSVEVRWENMDPGTYGSMNYRENVIKLDNGLRLGTRGEMARSALVHEIQHWIQETEGFASGTSLEAAARTAQRMGYDPLTPYQRKFMNDVQAFLDMKAYFDAKGVVPTDNNLAVWMKGSASDYDPDFAGDYILNATADEMMKEYERLREMDKKRVIVKAIDVYRNTAGEVEARNVQKRLDFSPMMRMQIPAESTEDVARKDQIVRFTDWGFSRGGLVTPEFVAAQAAQKVPGRDYSEGEADGVRFSLSNNNRKTVTNWLSKRKDLTDKQRKAVIDYLDAMDNPKLQLATAKWFAQGTIRLPEDMYKVEQAVSVSTKAKVDPLQYASPMELLDDHADIRPTEKRIDPNTVSTLHKAKEYPDYGIVVYDVDEGEQSRKNMREIINTHFGREASPWCLLRGDGNGNLTRDSKEYWHGYNAYPKQVAFRNGKLYAFSANDEKTRLWWDRQDNAYTGFPMDMEIPDDALGRSATYTLNPDTGELSSPKGKHRGNKKNGLYEEWNDWDVLIARFNYRDGRRFGLQETFYSGGEPCVRETLGERGENLGDYTVWYANGQLKNEWHFNDDGRADGLQRSYHANGQLHEERPMVDGKKEGIVQMWNDKGQLVVRQEYADDRRNGLEQTWSDNGTPETEINYKDGLRDGPSRVYWAGRLIREATYKKDMVVGEQKSWYQSGNIKSIRHFDDEGFLHGEQVEYYDFVGREEVFYRKNYNHGELDGPSEEWWDKDKPKLRETWSNGKHVGLFEEWYPNGVLQWRRNYNDKGQLDGVSEQYTAGGTLFERYTYKDGEIVEYRTGREVALEAENEGGVSFSIVSDKAEIERLEKIPTITLYRAMEKVGEGEYLPPMSQKIPNSKEDKGKRLKPRETVREGMWQRSDEDPAKAYQKEPDGPWYYDLKKVKGSDVNGVLYNPYLHLSASPLNDQFSSAWKRPNLVTVACEVPITELTSGYKAKKANDTVGAKDWHSGTVTAQLGEGRQVVLSRWAKIGREVPDDEVAKLVAPKLVKNGITVPENVVTPSLKAALERKGVKFSAPEEDEDGVKFSVVNNNQTIFVSNAQKAVEDIKNEKATPEQWLKQLEKGGLKAGEDKWLGLSDWLKASDKKTLTKQEILEYILDHRIEIEEQHYSENNDSYKEALESYQQEFDELVEKGREELNTGSMTDYYEYAFDNMVENYGDDFKIAFDWEPTRSGVVLVPSHDFYDDYSDVAKYYLEQRLPEGNTDRPINPTRLDYTTDGLANKREIALVVPAVKPYNEYNDVHFGDAGEGRAVAWIRFGDALLPKEKIEFREKAYADASSAERQYWQDLTRKYPGVSTVTDMEKAATKEEWDKFMELHHASDEAYGRTKYEGIPKERVLFLDEIQSKRHQDAREIDKQTGKPRGYEYTDEQQWEEVRDLMKKYNVAHPLNLDKAIEQEENKAVESITSLFHSFQARFPEGWTKEQRYERNGFVNSKLVPDPAIVGEEDAAWYVRMGDKRDEARADLDKVSIWRRGLNGVPGAPFEKNWHELAMKRMLRLAAEEGYDYIAWTTGGQQAERYNLGAAVQSIKVKPITENRREIEIYKSDGGFYGTIEESEGIIVSDGDGVLEGKTLNDAFGKDLAQKIRAVTESTTFSGGDLIIGGEGMKGFYDDILPRFMNKYGKKWGVKVEDIELPNLDNRENLPAHAVRVTDEMRESVMAGQPMFSVKDGQPPVKREGEDEYEYLQRSLDHLGKKYRWQVAGRIIGTKPARAESERGIPDELGAYDSGRIRIFVRKGETYEYGTHELAFFHENFHAWLDKNGHAGNSPFVVGLLRELREKGLVTNLDAKAEELKAAGYKDEDINEELAVRVVSDVMRRGLATRLEDSLSEDLNNVLNEYYNAIGYDKAEETSARRGTGSESRGRAVQDPDSTEEPGRAGAGLPGEAGNGRDASVRGDVGGNDGETRGDRFSKENAVTNTAAVLGVEVEFLPVSEMTVNGKRLAGRWQDGRISICPENCRSTDDAVRTVIHEAVGHNGLRKLVGAQDMRRFALALYRQLPRAARVEITDAAFSKYGGNIVEAVEEWLAERSEDMSFDKYPFEDEAQAGELTAWDRVKDAVRRLFVRFGIGPRLTDNDIRWILWQSYYANKEEDLPLMARRFALAHRLGFSASQQDDRALAQSVTRNKVAEEVSAARLYNMAVQGAKARLHEVFVDKDDAVNRLVDAIEKSSGKPAQDFEDVRLALNQQSSKGLAATEKFIREKYNPMMEAIKAIVKQGDLSVEDIERYVKIKHGIERNEVFAKRDARNYYRTLADKEIKRIKESDAEQDIKDSLISREKSKLDKHLERIDNGTDGKYKEFRKKDYGGLTSMYSEYDNIAPYQEGVESYEEYQARALKARHPMYETLEETEEAAEKEVRSFEESVGSNLTDELWKRINAATKATLQEQYKSNMMSKRQYEIVRDMFKFYVPLRGFKDNVASDMYNYYMSDNSGEFTPPLLKAGGRKTESESPFGYIGSMASSAITEGVKNQSKLALYYFITNRPDNDLMSASEVWYENTGMTDDGKRIFEPVYPPLTEDLSSESARKAYADWENAMEAKAKSGFAYKGANNIDLNDSVIHIDENQKNEHIIKFKVNGEEKMMFINGNPRAAQAINNMLNVNAAPSELVNALQKVLRYVAMINTQLNPEFWMTNMQRDLLFATMSESIKGDKAFNNAFRRNLVEARKVIKMRNAYNNGTLGDTPMEKLYREFVENGGVTGYSRVIGTEEWEREIRKFNKDDRKIIAAAKDVFDAVGGFGEAIEQLTRFAAYKTSREAGKGVIESVADAKELTVNFNRKGSGIAVTFDEAAKLRGADGKPLSKLEQALVVAASSLGAYGRAAIVFFNAAVQGLNNMVQLAKKQPKTMAIWTAGYFVLGVLNAALHAMLDDPDDDDYLDMPADERGNNLVLGGKGVYLKWALPQEMRVFYRLGDVLVNHALGRTPNKSVLGEMLHSVGEVSPIDFSSGISALAPSVVSPIVEIIKNEDWQGGRVYNDRKFMTKGEVKHHPKYTDPLKNTPEAYVAISKALNAISGGNSYEAGKVNVDPNILEHLFEGYTGGAGTSVEKLMVFLGNAAQGKFVVRNTPFLRRLLSISDERYRNAHVTELYYYYKDEAESTKRIYKKALKAGDEKMLEKLQRNGDLAVMQVYESYRKPMKTLDDDLKATQENDTDQRKAIMRQQDAMRKEMIKQISELK